MTSVSSGRRRGLNASTAIKSPVIAASTGNLTLSAEQTVDGIALVATNRVLCKDQTDASENGIYAVNSSTWVREPDWDGSGDVVEGTMIPVSRGTTNALTWWLVTNTGTITIGTTGTNTDITFAQGLTDVGIAATSTATDESTDTTCFPVFMTAATGNNALKSGSNLTFNSNTGEFGATIIAATGKATATTFEPTGDTTAGDNSALGYTSDGGAKLTGQGVTNDVELANDSDATALRVPTGTTNAAVVGNVIIDTAGKGVDFSANTETATGTMTSELFDWYEEGTWTPTLQDLTASDGEGQTYGAQFGIYTRIGRQVFIQGHIIMTSIGTLTGAEAASIAGLPFNASGTASSTASIHIGTASGLAITAGNYVTGTVNIGGASISLAVWSATTGSSGFTVTNMSADGALLFSGHYYI